MILKMYSVFDTKAKLYGQPVAQVSKGVAIRQFMEAVNSDGNHPMCKYPEDFALFEIGEFDDATGILKPSKCPMHCGNGNEFVAMNQVDSNSQLLGRGVAAVDSVSEHSSVNERSE